MNRATVLYVFMIVGGALGVAGIFVLSPEMKAARNVAGIWRLENPALPDAPARHLVIEQSGQFCRIKLDNGPQQDARLESDDDDASVRLITTNTIIHIRNPDTGDTAEIRIEDAPSAAPPATSTPATGFLAAPYRAERVPLAADAHSHTSPTGAPSKHLETFLLLTQVGIILALSQIVGWLFERVQQPRVMGEMIAGIMLGPSLFGWLWPDLWHFIFAPGTVQYLTVLSQVGVIFFLFLIGLELDPKLLSNRGHAAVVTSHASIIAPFILGGALAAYLYPLVFNQTPQMRFNSVALFMGAAMSITAFPVLARILTERNLHKTPVGALTITCAAVDDVTAWCMLAFVVGFAQADGLTPALVTAGVSAVYVVIMMFVVRPSLARLERVYERQGSLSAGVVGIVFLLVLVSACTTEVIGIHALFGAFLMGAVMPKSSRFVRELSGKLEDFVVIVLLPVFFAYTGLKTQIGLLNSVELWLLTGLIILVACAGKFGGSAVAARICGMNWREASAIGILMNTRGLMELVILNIGRELGVITDAVFAMMVLMAIVTTFLTTPILNWVYPDRLLRASRMRREIAPDAFGILIPIALPRSAKPLLRLADVIAGPDDAKRNIVGLYLRRAEEHEAYRAAVNDETAEEKAPLDTLLDAAANLNVPLHPVSFISRDAAADITRVAAENQVRLILMGFHKPVIGQTFLGGTVHRVLEQARSDIGIFIDRGLYAKPKTILVPYLGSPHDRLALEMASRMGRHANAAVTVLHVVAPGRDAGDARLGAKLVTDRIFADPTQPSPVSFKVIEHVDPITAVLEEAKRFDLVTIGIAEKWGLTSQLFGWRAERIARDCPSSLLIMRKSVESASQPSAAPAAQNAALPTDSLPTAQH